MLLSSQEYDKNPATFFFFELSKNETSIRLLSS